MLVQLPPPAVGAVHNGCVWFGVVGVDLPAYVCHTHTHTNPLTVLRAVVQAGPVAHAGRHKRCYTVGAKAVPPLQRIEGEALLCGSCRAAGMARLLQPPQVPHASLADLSAAAIRLAAGFLVAAHHWVACVCMCVCWLCVLVCVVVE